MDSSWTSRAFVLVIPAVSIAVLYGAYYAYQRIFPDRVASEKHKRVRTRQNEFKLATSLLDPQVKGLAGNIVTPWRSSASPSPASTPSEGWGWYNLAFTLMLLYTLSNAVHNTLTVGSIFKDTFVLQLALALPELLRDWAILAAVYAAYTFGCGLVITCVHSRVPLADVKRRNAFQMWLRVGLGIAEAGLLCGCVMYAHRRAEWPVTQRAAWLLQTVVLMCKMHSYISVNAQLMLEAECGGPGTGTIIFNVDHKDYVDMVRNRKLPANASISEAKLKSGDADAAVRENHSHDAATTTQSAPGAPKRSTTDGLRQRKGTKQAEEHVSSDDGNDATKRRRRSSSSVDDVLEGLQNEFKSDEAADAGDEPQSAGILYAAARHITFLGTPLEPEAVQNVETKHKGWSTKKYWQDRAEKAKAVIGKVIYGVNYEGQITTTGIVAFPNNINLKDFTLFSFSPVLCYEPNYPRTHHIRPGYLAEKIFLAMGLIVAGTFVHSQYVLPVIARVHTIGEIDSAVQLVAPVIALMMVFFFLVFECILNAFAELTYFGDRSFYEDWWNSTTFLEWSRKWNTPVHTFLLRHVYLDLMRQHGSSGNTALYVTFLVSIVLHEIVVYGITGLTVPWLGLFSLLQLPLGSIQRISIIKGKRLGNMILWLGLCIGITVITVLYSKDYCRRSPEVCQ